jgi:hypothetical protein
MEVINNSNSKHTRKNKLNVIVMYCRLFNAPDKLIEKYYNEMMKLGEEIKQDYLKNEKNEKQEENWLEKKELEELLKKLQAKVSKDIDTYSEYKQFLKWFMLYFHIKYPIRNELSDTKIFLSSDGADLTNELYNYIVIFKSKPSVFIMNNYKTSGTYGSKTIELDKDTSAILRKYYSIIKKFSPNNFIVVDKNGDGISRNAYTKRFQEIFKDENKKIGSSMIRHIIVSDEFKPVAGEMQKRTLLADLMGNSIIQQMTTYSKV